MNLRKDIVSSVIGIVLFTLLCGGAIPLAVEVFGQVAFPGNANGQKVYVDGKLVGSKLIGQNFGDIVAKNGKPETLNGNPVTTPDPRYFQTRPSGTTPSDNASATTFANYGPNSEATKAALLANVQTYLGLNCATTLTSSGSCSHWYDPAVTSAAQVPVDAADTSASGVDPDISPANADIQAYRLAAVRHLSLSTVMRLVSKYTGGRGLGFSGEQTVNVLELNVALNQMTGAA